MVLKLVLTIFSLINLIQCAKDCKELRENGELTSGVYSVNPDGGDPFDVYCDMVTSGDYGGWTVFQRRKDGSVDFYRDWDDYVNGFGDLEGEFWLGLEKIHRLTEAFRFVRGTALRIDLKDFDNEERYAEYGQFQVGPGEGDQKYMLYVNRYYGDAGDSLSFHSSYWFSTKDNDNDIWEFGSCAEENEGGWWYHRCVTSCLNGLYLGGAHEDSYANGVNWFTFRGLRYSLAKTEMKLKSL